MQKKMENTLSHICLFLDSLIFFRVKITEEKKYNSIQVKNYVK